MTRDNSLYGTYLSILTGELKTALGCTEPIALAFAAAKARETLGGLPDTCLAEICGNIIKNAKSVTVPNANGLKGIEAAIAAGIIGGDSSKELEVLTGITPEQQSTITDFMKKVPVRVVPADSDKTLYIRITLTKGADSVSVVIADQHSHIVSIVKNGETLFSSDEDKGPGGCGEEYGLLSIANIFDFCKTAELSDFAPVIERQITLNSAISAEGLTSNYGANIGKVMKLMHPGDVYAACQAAAAAGSDARMSGCELPVVIVSGSGNQGITASMPVVEYARQKGFSHEELLRAVLLSDLVTIHQKTGIGRLSAYCGAVSAGIGAACGIAFLDGGDTDTIAHTLVNAIAISSGIVCDGAKPSCAAKISTAVFAGLLGYEMYKNGQQFYSGDGLVVKGVENTIRNIGLLAREGMAETDKEIIRLMTAKSCD